MTAYMDVDAAVVGQPNPSARIFPSCNSHNPPEQLSHSTTIPRHTVKSNQIDDEQSGVKHGHKAGFKNIQTNEEQSEVRNDNKAAENKNNQTNDEQSGNTHGHEAGAKKPVSKFTLIELQVDLLEFPHSITHCIPVDFQVGAGLAKKNQRKVSE